MRSKWRGFGVVRRLLESLGRLVEGANDRIGVVIRWLALAMVLVGAGTAIVRFASGQLAFSVNLTPPTEVQWYLFSVIFLLGAAYGLKHNVHVRVDVLYERLSKRAQSWIDLSGGVLFLIPFCGAMLYFSWDPVLTSWQVREISPDPGGLPRWPIKALILVSFALLALQGIVQIKKNMRAILDTRRDVSGQQATSGAGGGGQGMPMEPS